MGLKIGEGEYDIAKKIAIFSLLWIIIISVIGGILLNIFVSNIASIFTQVESNKEVLERFLTVWSWIVPFDMIWPCFCALFKLVDKVTANSIITVITWLVIPPLFTFYGLFLSDIGGIASVACWLPTLLICDGISFFIIFFATDWHKIPRLLINSSDKLENIDPNNIELNLLENEKS